MGCILQHIWTIMFCSAGREVLVHKTHLPGPVDPEMPDLPAQSASPAPRCVFCIHICGLLCAKHSLVAEANASAYVHV